MIVLGTATRSDHSSTRFLDVAEPAVPRGDKVRDESLAGEGQLLRRRAADRPEG